MPGEDNSDFCRPDKADGVESFLNRSGRREAASGNCPLTRSDVESLIASASGAAGVDLSGRNLNSADLSGLNLRSVSLAGADLGHVNLRNADLFGANLSGTDLFRADLRGACLGRCSLDSAFLMGIQIDEHTDLADVKWGDSYICEWERLGMLDNARSQYRQLFSWHRSHGYGDLAGEFLYRDWVCRRRQTGSDVASAWKRRKPWQWGFLLKRSWWSSVRNLALLAGFEAAFGYGERPLRICFAAAFVVLFFTALFFLAPESPKSDWTSPSRLWDCFYFSLVSFTTMGYGGWVEAPGPWARHLGAIESFIGLFVTAMFLVTFTRRWTR